jgi:O-antigen/teichoic acid export membrane protein
MLGLQVGITRYISSYKARQDNNSIGRLFFSVVILLLFIITIVILSSLIAKNKIAQYIFNDAGLDFLVIVIVINTAGLLIHQLNFSYFRGLLQIKKANFIQFVILGIIPIFSFVILDDFNLILLVISISVTLISLMITIGILFVQKKYLAFDFKILKEILKFSFPRMPGQFTFGLMFSSLPLFITKYYGVVIAGKVAFGLSILNMAGSAFNPIGLVLLPRLREIIVKKHFTLLRSYIRKLMLFVGILSLGGFLIFQIFGKQIIGIYLGKEDIEIVKYSRIIFTAILFFPFYVTFRSLLDATWEKAYNTLNIFYSFFVFILGIVIVSLFYVNIEAYLVSFVLSISLLGLITLYYTKKIYQLKI